MELQEHLHSKSISKVSVSCRVFTSMYRVSPSSGHSLAWGLVIRIFIIWKIIALVLFWLELQHKKMAHYCILTEDEPEKSYKHTVTCRLNSMTSPDLMPSHWLVDWKELSPPHRVLYSTDTSELLLSVSCTLAESFWCVRKVIHKFRETS